MKQQRGFTLVELIVVIAILGILAATALPKFIDVSTQAKKAAADGLIGAIVGAVNLCQAQWVAAGSTGGTCTMGGATVTAPSGIPAATSAGIGAAVIASGFVTTAIPVYTLSSDSSCTVTYTITSPYATRGGTCAP